MRDSRLNVFFTPVTRLKGVGEGLAGALMRAVGAPGVPVLRDLLFHLPVGLVDRRKGGSLMQVPSGETATYVVTVRAHMAPARGRFGGKSPYKVLCGNDTGDLTLVFFNASQSYMQTALPVGQTRVVSGVVERFDGRAQMTHPDVIATVDRLSEVQRVEPVYPLSAGITSKRMGSLIAQALGKVVPLPEWNAKAALPFDVALKQAHAPGEAEDLLPHSPPRLRLAYDEALAYQMHLSRVRELRTKKEGRVLRGGEKRAAMQDSLPFALTSGQARALKEIDEDMASGNRMARFVQGDVGSGKTVVALLAALNAVDNGAQAAVMAPTEIIAQQHAETFSRFGADVVLLTGSVRGAARTRALEAIATGSAGIVIGTHALFQDKVQFHDLGLVVVDEQHRFGVAQRGALSAKGASPHLLQMSATPIPRSLTLTLYGDMDCSLIPEKPPGRQKVVTRALPMSRWEELASRLEAALARGEKAYWICPLIEESENAQADAAAAELRFTEFRARFGAQVGLAHGRMKAEERTEALHAFARGDVRLLVATTVVEVGVDVPDATIMVIEQAERFGLSQLHQLRGRVGRGTAESFCVLLYSDQVGEDGIHRLSVLRDSEDGFFIAEKDLQLRGGGDLLGTRQSGLPRFYFLDLLLHQEILEEAKLDAAKAEMTPERALLMQLFGYAEG